MKNIFVSFLTVSLTAFFLSCERGDEPKKKEDIVKKQVESSLKELKILDPENTSKVISELRKLMEENPDHCAVLIGLPAAQIQYYFLNIANIIQAILQLSQGEESSPPSKISPSQIEEIIEEFVRDIYDETQEGVKLLERAFEKNCELYVELPIKIVPSPTFQVELTFVGVWGKVEILVLNYIGYSVLALIDFILSHRYDINLAEALRFFRKIETNSAVGFIRSLAFLPQSSPTFLTFSDEWQERFPRIPLEIAQAIAQASQVPTQLEERGKQEKYLVWFEDNSGEGKIGYPETVTVGQKPDKIVIGIKGRVKVGDLFFKISRIEVEIPLGLTFSRIESISKTARKVEDVLRNGKTGLENSISIKDINAVFEIFGVRKFTDFARVDISKFFKAGKPLRDFLPIWTFYESRERWEFLVEAEVPEDREIPQGAEDYFFNYDAPHFVTPPAVQFEGEYIEGLTIPRDCVFAEELPSWAFVPYIYFQDPTFGGTVYVKFATDTATDIVFCNPEDYNFPDWKHPDNYALAKVIATIIARSAALAGPISEILIKAIKQE